MTTVHDVTAYILSKQGPISAMKLQKLVYYTQAWSLVWDERPLFNEKIEAWTNGPVIPVLYEKHRGIYTVSDWPLGDASHLDAAAIDTVDAVLAFYGGMNAQMLSDLTHREDPWVNSRKVLNDGERSNKEITHATMAEYYSSLQ